MTRIPITDGHNKVFIPVVGETMKKAYSVPIKTPVATIHIMSDDISIHVLSRWQMIKLLLRTVLRGVT